MRTTDLPRHLSPRRLWTFHIKGGDIACKEGGDPVTRRSQSPASNRKFYQRKQGARPDLRGG